MGTAQDETGLTRRETESPADAAADAAAERRLVEEARGGDLRAFEALVRRYERWIFTLAARMVGDRAEAEDLAQEIFLKAYRGLGGFRGGSRFSTWLYAIATHHCLNHLAGRETRMRRAARQAGNPGDRADGTGSALDRLPDGSPGPDAVLERQDLRRAIERGLAQLSEEHRMVVVLRDVQGLSYDEIAGVLGVELGTVRSRLHRARAELRQRLAPHLDEGGAR